MITIISLSADIKYSSEFILLMKYLMVLIWLLCPFKETVILFSNKEITSNL